MSQGVGTFLRHRVGGRGLAGRFAPCPPAFGLLLDLRKTPSQPALGAVFSLPLNKPTFAATGAVCLPQRSQGGARRAGDMSGGRYAVTVAGSEIVDRGRAVAQRHATTTVLDTEKEGRI